MAHLAGHRENPFGLRRKGMRLVSEDLLHIEGKLLYDRIFTISRDQIIGDGLNLRRKIARRFRSPGRKIHDPLEHAEIELVCRILVALQMRIGEEPVDRSGDKEIKLNSLTEKIGRLRQPALK